MWPEQSPTQELLALAKQGDGRAVNHLLDRHRDALRRLVEMRLDRKLKRRVDASDVVQDVLIEANTRLADYLNTGSMPFHLWLRQIAKDRIIDLHRRHHAQRRDVDLEQGQPKFSLDQSSIDLLAAIPDLELTPAAATMRREMELRFHAAIDTLEEQDREILVMRHVEQLSNGEVAADLNLTPAAAGMRYIRALRRLRTVLGENSSD